MIALIAAASPVGAADSAAAKKGPRASASLNAQDRGKYMLIVGSCNDCHTAGFAARSGDVPEREWLMGSGNLGFNGPWGTTYAPNLRLVLSKMTEAQWVRYAKDLKSKPPYPDIVDRVLPAHDQFWKTEEAMAEGNPVMALERVISRLRLHESATRRR